MNRRQGINKTNYGLVYLGIYALHGVGELNVINNIDMLVIFLIVIGHLSWD